METTSPTTSAPSQDTLTTSSNVNSTTHTTEAQVIIEEVEIVNEGIYVDELLEFNIIEDEQKRVSSTDYNPYNYQEIRVEMTFIKPSQQAYNQYAFWYRDYLKLDVIGKETNEAGFITKGQEYINWGDNSYSHYRVRITPNETGLWQYEMRLIINNQTTQTKSGEFIVSDKDKRSAGFIRVDEVNKRNFIFEQSQETYIPSGINLAWYASSLGTHDYFNWFKKMNEVDMNMARIWLASWSFSLHKDSYDNFDTRQNILARLDYLFNFAKEHQVYIMLTLLNHGQFSANTNPEWSHNPYNQEIGGMLEYPIQFFYNEEAKSAYKNELLYLIARYSYSEELFAWELFNEVDWVDGYSGLIVTRWHDEMAKFIKENDPYSHLITTSYKYPFNTPAFDLDSLDFANYHSYGFYNKNYIQEVNNDMIRLFDTYQKPHFYGEIGIDWQSGNNTYNLDPYGVTLRQAQWSGIMSSSGSANQWWWDSWVEKHNLWSKMQGASVFAKMVDVANKEYTLLQTQNSLSINNSSIGILGYKLENTIYGYLFNRHWSYSNHSPELIENIIVNIPFPNGEYNLSIYDTLTGELINETTVLVEEYLFILEIDSIQTDFAFILSKEKNI